MQWAEDQECPCRVKRMPWYSSNEKVHYFSINLPHFLRTTDSHWNWTDILLSEWGSTSISIHKYYYYYLFFFYTQSQSFTRRSNQHKRKSPLRYGRLTSTAAATTPASCHLHDATGGTCSVDKDMHPNCGAIYIHGHSKEPCGDPTRPLFSMQAVTIATVVLAPCASPVSSWSVATNILVGKKCHPFSPIGHCMVLRVWVQCKYLACFWTRRIYWWILLPAMNLEFFEWKGIRCLRGGWGFVAKNCERMSMKIDMICLFR